MNVDFLIKTNPFNIPGIQAAQKVAETNAPKAESTQTATQTKAPSGANFVQKIKDTNDAIGFIQTGQAFLARLEKDGITNFEDAKKLADSMSFSGKSIGSKQGFDTTAGTINIDLTSQEIGFENGDFESWKRAAADMLKAKKEQISNPLAAFGAAKKEQMESAAEKITAQNQNPKLGSIFDSINESLNKFEQRANELGDALF